MLIFTGFGWDNREKEDVSPGARVRRPKRSKQTTQSLCRGCSDQHHCTEPRYPGEKITTIIFL